MNYVRWNEWDGLWTEGIKNETWSMTCGMKKMRWNMNNKVDNVTSPSLNSTTLQVGQKCYTLFFVYKIIHFVQLAGI